MNSNNWIVASVLACATLLSACGGGGGSAGDTPLGQGTGTNDPVASDLSISVGNGGQLSNTDNAFVTVTATAVDASRNVLKDIPVKFSVSNSGTEYVIPKSEKTDASGRITAEVYVGANKANRDIQVFVASGAVKKTEQIRVVGVTISSTLTPSLVEPGQKGRITYRVVDQSNQVIKNQQVNISASGLSSTNQTGATNSNGEYNFEYTAPSAAGNYVVTASIAGATDQRTVSVQPATNEEDPVSQPILTAAISADPPVISPNLAGSESNRSQIRIKFATTNSQPLKNVRVKFVLDDPRGVGGRLLNAELSRPLLSTDAGFVDTTYIAGTRSSPTEGIQVRACYGATDAAALACGTFATTKITVAQDALSVSIGGDEIIVVSDLIYQKRYRVSVVDASGFAKQDVNLAVSLDLPEYWRGYYRIEGDAWATERVISPAGVSPLVFGDFTRKRCDSEDTDRSGLYTVAKDKDEDGVLDPRPSDVQITFEKPVSADRPREAKTDAAGSAVVVITYTRSFATWVKAVIKVAASGISGSEGQYSYDINRLPAPADVFKNKEVTPPFAISPYGQDLQCSPTP